MSQPERPDRPFQSSGAHRPDRLESLLFQGEPYPNWPLRNGRKLRFYVLNLGHVMDLLQLNHTSAGPYFEAATDVIRERTDWRDLYRGDFTCSKTQIYPENQRKPKLLDKAAAIIVALELAAAEKQPDLSVYDYLRIVPAFYFVDQLDADRLNALRVHFERLSETEKAAMVPADAAPGVAARGFDAICGARIGQVEAAKLLQQMTKGYCVTQSVADALVAFVNDAFPAALHVGPVRKAGDGDAISLALGNKDACAALRAPSFREPSDLNPL